MYTRRLLKACISMSVVILSVVFFTQNAFPWGSATHAYIGDKIGLNLPLQNLDEIYGAMAPDMFNFNPEVLVPGTIYNDLYIQTHYNSFALWSVAQNPAMTPLGKAAAFGFVSHANGQFGSTYAGADYTAHGPSGDNPGFYVIDKTNTLWAALKPQLEANGIFLTDFQGLSASHNIVEYAIDIMIAYEKSGGVNGSGIGEKMAQSALLRTLKFPQLVVKAYATDSDTKEKIITAERDFRRSIIIYGQALSEKTESAAISSVAGLLAQLAQEVYGIQVPADFVAGALVVAQDLCRPDYANAINQTIGFVNSKMAEAGIQYQKK